MGPKQAAPGARLRTLVSLITRLYFALIICHSDTGVEHHPSPLANWDRACSPLSPPHDPSEEPIVPGGTQSAPCDMPPPNASGEASATGQRVTRKKGKAKRL